MLGNQYFIAENYYEAIRVYKNLITDKKANTEIQKKIIVSYLKTYQINSAIKQSEKYFKRATILAPDDGHLKKINEIIFNN